MPNAKFKHYVVCYVTNTAGEILLIEKNKPAWQKGRFNLVGGSVEDNELSQQAAVRELFEETGLQVQSFPDYVGSITGDGFLVDVIRLELPPGPQTLEQKTPERVFFADIEQAMLDPRLIPNLRVIIPLLSRNVTGWLLRDIVDGDPAAIEFNLKFVA